MEESLLHFIWRFQHFKSRALATIDGHKISVLDPGVRNIHAGPDFAQARIRISDIVWNGHVEIHIKTSDWNRHGHQRDEAYDNVILQVVWVNDENVMRKDGTMIPTLEVRSIVDDRIIKNYHDLLRPEDEVLCGRFLQSVKRITIYNMLDRALTERLKKKSDRIFREIALAGNDWEEIAWRMLCRNFGFKTNAEPFYELGRSLPVKILKKEAQNPLTIEALLFGQAGFLNDDQDDEYFLLLKKEYDFKKKKYRLEKRIEKHQWKFLRLRPPNFPTIRLAQLTALVAAHPNLFSFFIHWDQPKELLDGLATKQSGYWQKHYNFGLEARRPPGTLGKASRENILINTVAPLLFAYGMHKDDEDLKDKAVRLLTAVKAEQNHITRKWTAAGWQIRSAFDSQAVIELFTEYCGRKRCLQCTIGAEIIAKKP